MSNRSPKGGGGNSHQRTVFGLTPKTKVVVAPITAQNKFLNFLEHPLFTLPVSIVGGLVGIIYYYQASFLCVACILLAFHRTGVVSGQKRISQICTYACVAAVSTMELLSLGYAVKKKSHDDLLVSLQEAAKALGNNRPHIELGEPEPNSLHPTVFQIPIVNTGDETARNKVNTGGVFIRRVGEIGERSETEIFSYLNQQQDRLDNSQQDIEPGNQHRDYVQLTYAPSALEAEELKDHTWGGIYRIGCHLL